MTRLTRLSLAEHAHYVILRCVPDISLIPFDSNIEKLFEIFTAESRKNQVDISAFAIFTDQIHLILTPRASAQDLSAFVQQLSRLYSRYFNEEFSRIGKIWQGRFESSVLQGSGVVLKATVWMESLPEFLGYGESQYYPWTSYFHHSGVRSDYFLVPSSEYWRLGNTPFERQKKYKKIFAQGPDENFGRALLTSVKRGWPVADKEFLENLGVNSARIAPLRKRGRPSKKIAF